jgi:outer membrane murein-binding lipoprotein Lpp
MLKAKPRTKNGETKYSLALDLIEKAVKENVSTTDSKAIQAEIKQKRKEQAALEAKVEKLDTQIEGLRSKIDDLEGKISDLECEQESAQDDSDALDEEILDLENDSSDEESDMDSALCDVQNELLDENVIVVLEGGKVRKATVLDVESIEDEGAIHVKVFPPNDDEVPFEKTLKAKRVVDMFKNGNWDLIVAQVAKNKSKYSK